MYINVHITMYMVLVKCTLIYTLQCTISIKYQYLTSMFGCHCRLNRSLYPVHCTLYTVHCTLYTVYIVQCTTVYNVQQ